MLECVETTEMREFLNEDEDSKIMCTDKPILPLVSWNEADHW